MRTKLLLVWYTCGVCGSRYADSPAHVSARGHTERVWEGHHVLSGCTLLCLAP
jgi:hypothetical protein